MVYKIGNNCHSIIYPSLTYGELCTSVKFQVDSYKFWTHEKMSLSKILSQAQNYKVGEALTFLELTVLVADGRGFWAAMDRMKRGVKAAELCVLAFFLLVQLLIVGTALLLLLLQIVMASIFSLRVELLRWWWRVLGSWVLHSLNE